MFNLMIINNLTSDSRWGIEYSRYHLPPKKVKWFDGKHESK